MSDAVRILPGTELLSAQSCTLWVRCKTLQGFAWFGRHWQSQKFHQVFLMGLAIICTKVVIQYSERKEGKEDNDFHLRGKSKGIKGNYNDKMVDIGYHLNRDLLYLGIKKKYK